MLNCYSCGLVVSQPAFVLMRRDILVIICSYLYAVNDNDVALNLYGGRVSRFCFIKMSKM